MQLTAFKVKTSSFHIIEMEETMEGWKKKVTCLNGLARMKFAASQTYSSAFIMAREKEVASFSYFTHMDEKERLYV